LPEDLLLRRTLELPKLQPSELLAALTLEAQALSPFTLSDMAWAYEIALHDGNSTTAYIAISSRKLIAKHLAAVHPQIQSQIPEVWLLRVSGPGFVPLSGFGEARRQRQSTAWRSASALLALLALAILTAIAITPSLQLYLRALQANQAMTSMGQRAKPAIAQRESLIRASEQLADLARLVGKPVPPLQTLKVITQALPDDTSLLGLQIQGLKVSISGQTANAAALMKQLDTTPGLRDVKAPAPATKPLGAPRESFTIEFVLDPTKLKPAP
jgi:general secretion pathway protein L